jgi:RNase H-fold protein (predicted Holliday junction resolvase)
LLLKIFCKEKVEAVLWVKTKQMNGQPSESADDKRICNSFTNHFQMKVIRVDERFTSKGFSIYD